MSVDHEARAKTLQSAIDAFLAPIYMDAGRLVSEGGTTPLARALEYTSVTCADLQKLYDDTYPPELAGSNPTGPGIVSVDEFVRIITHGPDKADAP